MAFENQSHLWIDEGGAFLDVADLEGNSTFAHIRYFSSKADFCVVNLDEGQISLPPGLYRVELEKDCTPRIFQAASDRDIEELEALFGVSW
jgi:hypothetical protein